MLATFVHKWARRYIGVTQPLRYSPHKRARLRAFFSDGVDKWHVSWAVEALPTLLHLSLFLFFVGLVIYLFSANHVVFGTVVWWVVLSMMAYLCITLLPIIRPNCPYHAPLSSPIWYLYGSIQFALINILSSPVVGYFHSDTADRFRGLKTQFNEFFEDMGRTAEERVWKQASEIDVRVLQSTFDAHDEAGAQEEFFRAIPGFFESKLVYGLEENLTDEFRVKFREALNRFLDRTVSLTSLSESARSGRLVICLNAARAALGFDGVSQILWDVLNGRWSELVHSVDMVQSLRQWSNKSDRQFISYVQRIVAQVVVEVRDRDERWISLVKAEFAVPDRVLRRYIPHGDSVLLAILIHMTRQAFQTGSWTEWVLSSFSGFDIDDTIPGLQHVFCDLWNEILFKARDLGEDNTYVNILREIRHAYIDLHRRTDAAPMFSAAAYDFDPDLGQPWSYRYCNIASHRQDLASSTVQTPVRSSGVVHSPTRLNGWPDAFPHPSPSRHHHTPGGSTLSLEPSPDHTPHRTQGFTWPSPTTDFVHIYTQPPSVSSTSVHESIRTAITLDPGLLVPREASPGPCLAAQSDTDIAARKFVRSDDLTSQIHTSESGEAFLAPVASSLIFQRSEPVLATVTPSTGHDPGDDPDALHDTTSTAPLSHPLEGTTKQRDIVVPRATPDISDALSTVPIPQSNTIVSPAIVVSDDLSSPVLLLAHSSVMATAESPSFIGSAPIEVDHIPHAFWPPSPSPSSIPAGSYDTGDPSPPIPMTALLHSGQTAPPAHDIAAATLQTEDVHCTA